MYQRKTFSCLSFSQTTSHWLIHAKQIVENVHKDTLTFFGKTQNEMQQRRNEQQLFENLSENKISAFILMKQFMLLEFQNRNLNTSCLFNAAKENHGTRRSVRLIITITFSDENAIEQFNYQLNEAKLAKYKCNGSEKNELKKRISLAKEEARTLLSLLNILVPFTCSMQKVILAYLFFDPSDSLASYYLEHLTRKILWPDSASLSEDHFADFPLRPKLTY